MAIGAALASAEIRREMCRRPLRQQLRECSHDQVATLLLSLSGDSSREVRRLVAPLIRELRIPTELAPSSPPGGRGDEVTAGEESV